MAAPRAVASPVMAAVPAKRLWRRAGPVAAASLATGLLAAFAAWQLKPAPPVELTRFAIVVPDEQALSGVAGKILDLSPDGRNLVYTANGMLYLRPLSSMIATAVQGTENLKERRRSRILPGRAAPGLPRPGRQRQTNCRRWRRRGAHLQPRRSAILVVVGGRSNFRRHGGRSAARGCKWRYAGNDRQQRSG